MEKEKVAIIGGRGAMGQRTAEICIANNMEVIVSDIADPNTIPADRAVDIVGSVIVSVPIDQVSGVIWSLDSVMRPEHKVIDNASAKSEIIPVLRSLDERGVSVCSTHPMSAPNISWEGQSVFIMDVGNNSGRAREFAEKLYGSANMNIVPFDIDKHDGNMNLKQGLRHLINQGFLSLVSDEGLTMEEVMFNSSPNGRLADISVMRTVIQSPELSGRIIHEMLKTEGGLRVAERLLDNLQKLVAEAKKHNPSQKLEENRDKVTTEAFRQEMTELTNGVVQFITGKM